MEPSVHQVIMREVAELESQPLSNDFQEEVAKLLQLSHSDIHSEAVGFLSNSKTARMNLTKTLKLIKLTDDDGLEAFLIVVS